MILRVAALAALLTTACAATALHGPRRSQEAEVLTSMNLFLSALNGLDLKAMVALFDEEITAFVPSAQAHRVEGKAAVETIFRTFVTRASESRARSPIVPQDFDVAVSGDLALVSFSVHADGGITRRRTFVFVRRESRWLIRHFHASDFSVTR